MTQYFRPTGCRWGVVAVAWALALALVWGCAAGGYGRIATDNEVTAMFRSNRVPEHFKYYFNGSSNAPYAIIGMDPAYPYQLKFWDPVMPNGDDFAGKVRAMYHPVLLFQPDKATGAWIINGEGKKVGIWYSIYSGTTVSEKDGVVSVFSPFRPIL